jgi:hypothetical protein
VVPELTFQLFHPLRRYLKGGDPCAGACAVYPLRSRWRISEILEVPKPFAFEIRNYRSWRTVALSRLGMARGDVWTSSR